MHVHISPALNARKMAMIAAIMNKRIKVGSSGCILTPGIDFGGGASNPLPYSVSAAGFSYSRFGSDGVVAYLIIGRKVYGDRI